MTRAKPPSVSPPAADVGGRRAADKDLPGEGEKLPWEPPRIKSGQLFESNSLSCGKSTPMMEPCLQNPQVS